ncbi:1-acyl-sn-glycerol-3-phosphate acyltransferase [Halocola ammonii]
MKRFSIGYAFLKVLVGAGARVFYKNYVIVGHKNFPKGETPVVLAANHQNALMDAIVCCVTAPKQLSFLTRADIFQNPTAYRLLTHLNMLPIYRQKDKVDQVALNEVIFQECFKRLRSGGAISLFPEGNHNNKKFLRPMRKGLARVAFGAEESGNFNLDLQVIPVGIDFSEYTTFRADLLVIYGKPISMKPFVELYKSEPARAYTELMKEVKERIGEQMVNITDKENYSLVRKLEPLAMSGAIGDARPRGYFERWKLLKKFTDGWSKNASGRGEKVAVLKEVFSKYESALGKMGLSVKDAETKTPGAAAEAGLYLILVLLFPLFALGALLNAVPALLVDWVVKTKIRDPHFKSSIMLALGVFVFPIWWIILSVVLLLITSWWWSAGAFLIFAGLSGIFAVNWIESWRFLRIANRKRKLRKSASENERIANLRTELIDQAKEITR